MPLPNDDVTPPVTKTYFATGIVLRGFSDATEEPAVPQRQRREASGRVHAPRVNGGRSITTVRRIKGSRHAVGGTHATRIHPVLIVSRSDATAFSGGVVL